MSKIDPELKTKGELVREAARKLRQVSSAVRDQALRNIARALIEYQGELLEANQEDMESGHLRGMSPAMLDRLLLTKERLTTMSQDVMTIALLPDPIGEIFDMRTLPNGLIIGKKRVPLGVVGCIYESRPNVTIDIASLCLKSGNAAILRGGKEALHSNIALANLARKAIAEAGTSEESLQLIENTDRAIVNDMVQMSSIIDLLIPRGGAGLINFVKASATIPVVAGGVGVCHTYVDRSADLRKAVAIAFNAKVQRPTVCNALDTLLVHQDVAQEFLPQIAEAWGKAGVEIHADVQAMDILRGYSPLQPASPDDWGKEFLALVAAVKVVSSLEEAIEHIERYGSGHSEAIVTEDYTAAKHFLDDVDAACVYVNASTRFTDGGQFGLGAEVGISTQKMHARGPMGVKELTSYKWIILGSGQVRP